MPPLLRTNITRASNSNEISVPGSFPSPPSSSSSPESPVSPPPITLAEDSSSNVQPRKRTRRKTLLYPESASWQSRLPSSTPLSHLFIPGTHDSLATRFSLFGAKCQSLSILQQLESGIRFFDFRLRLDQPGSGELLAYHGSLPMGIDLGSVMEVVYEFLESDEGRGETVIISFKQENTSNPLFASTLLQLLRERKNLWYFENRWPLLEEVRGKCVLFCRFDFDAGLGLHPIDWPYNSKQVWETEIGAKQVQVQDWHGIPSHHSLPFKSSLALSLFPPFSSQSQSRYRINYLSCSSPNPFSLGFPQFCSKGFFASKWWGFKGINELVLEGLKGFEEEGEKQREEEEEEGMVVMMDYCEFPNEGELVRKVIEMNFPRLLEN